MFLGIYNRAGVVTLSGLILALSACILSYNQRFEWAVVCFMFAGICDLFDGVVARKSRLSAMEKEFGMHLDSLVDIVSFGITPGIILLHSGFNHWPDYLLTMLFCCAAVVRLAFFNASKQAQGQDPRMFTGLPVTYSALVLPLVFTLGTFISPEASTALVRFTLLLLGVLYVLKIPVPKPSGIFYVVFPSVGVVLSIFWIIRAMQ